MKIDLNKGVFIQISGEVGKFNSLPVDYLAKFAQELQDLIKMLAKYDLPTDEAIDFDNFKIDLVDFKPGSAVPKFAFSQTSQSKASLHWTIHRNKVNESFERLIEISNSGDYSKLKDIYPEPIKRNPIVDKFYNFRNSFGNAPVTIVDYNQKSKSITPIYKLEKFKSSVKNDLVTTIKEETKTADEPNVGYGKIQKTKTKYGKTRRKVMSFYSHENMALEYAPVVIIANETTYSLKHPLRCLFDHSEGFYTIQNEMLGIIGTGETKDEAELSFSEHFSYVFERLNSLSDDKLTKNNIFIKSIINQIVDTVE